MTSCERAVKTINQHGKEPLLSAIMAFNDIEPMRGSNTGRCVLHIDIEKAASTEVNAALSSLWKGKCGIHDTGAR